MSSNAVAHIRHALNALGLDRQAAKGFEQGLFFNRPFAILFSTARQRQRVEDPQQIPEERFPPHCRFG